MVVASSSDLSLSEFVIGGLVILGFLVVAYGIGKVLGRYKNTQFTRAWAPLVPLINGTIHQDNGGSDTSWLQGTYKGRQVRASMTPGQNKYTYTTSPDRFNYFELKLLEEPGKQDWSIVYETRVLGIGQTGWQIRAEPSLQAQLKQQVIPAQFTALGLSKVSFHQPGSLLLTADVTPRWVPSASRFQEQLDLLLELSQVNRQINGPQ